MDLLLVVVVAVVAVAIVTALAERMGVAGPLLLVALGLGVGILPFVDVPEIDPELILVGILPPLLYAAAVRLPAIEFRRDFIPISGLAVFLVVISSLVLGWFFSLVLPGVGFALGVALGAILSPTDAVATGIAKRLGIAPRVIVMLEGESLLNDATALVVLRTALIAVAAGTFSFQAALGAFAWAVFIAVVIGALTGFVASRLRAWVGSSAASTAIGFTVPFVALLPTEHLGGSGLVAAVVAGIVTGQSSLRDLTPEQRLSDEVNWRTVELVLEGGIFLIMGLELDQIVEDVSARHEGIALATGAALAALGIALVVRAAYVAFLLWAGHSRAGRLDRGRLEQLDARIDAIEERGPLEVPAPGGRSRRNDTPERAQHRLRWMRARIERALADIDYYHSSRLGWKHGTVIVWAGMRGVVTLAAAQTIPRTVEQRPELVYIAFIVALVSLMLQGFTLPLLVRALRFDGAAASASDAEEQERLDDELRAAAGNALRNPALKRSDGSPFEPHLVERTRERLGQQVAPDQASARDMLELRVAIIEAQRARLSALASGGTFSSRALRHSLAELDADQLSTELRLRDETG